MEAQIDTRMSSERLLSRLTGLFGGLATLLAAIGLYGVLAYSVARRTREIGIRIALGAKATHVRGLVVRDVAVMLVCGTALGLAAAGLVSRSLRGMLFNVQPLDVPLYVGAVVALAAVAIAAAYLPARRATTVDPLIALRYE
jgi:ABC-type antimicrobial peptide transport system permease subunit